MQISTRTEYALRALLEMLKMDNSPVSAQKICERQNLPKKYIERLLGNLKNAGITESLSGVKGGYVLARKPEAITLLQVMQAVEDHSWEMSCIANPPEHCMGKGCGLQNVWKDVYGKMQHTLSEYNLVSIAHMQQCCDDSGSSELADYRQASEKGSRLGGNDGANTKDELK